jgi:glycosyltransferase involved in cell wall biosynthesis
VNVSVYSMRKPPADAAELLDERDLSGLPTNQCSFAAELRGVVMLFRRPFITARLLAWLVVRSWRRPIQLLTSFVAIPRSLDILGSLERERPDVVHLFWGHYPCVVGYLVATRLPNTVLSMFIGAYDLECAYGGTRWVASRANLISTHSRSNFAVLEALGVRHDRVHLAYRGLDPCWFASPSVPKTRHRIVAAGRLDAEKGMDDALRAFSRIHLGWPDATLRIVGEGPQRARLERLSRRLGIESSVTFPGHMSQFDLRKELCAAEIFLHMSWGDGERLPNVVKEAMASRCVCVVTRTPGIEELVRDGDHGFVVALHDIDTAAARVDAVFGGRVDTAAMSFTAFDRVRESFDAASSMTSYRDRWKNVLGTSNSPEA